MRKTKVWPQFPPALFAGHHPQNHASRALLARLGFTCIGTHYFAPTGLQHPWHRRDRVGMMGG